MTLSAVTVSALESMSLAVSDVHHRLAGGAIDADVDPVRLMRLARLLSETAASLASEAVAKVMADRRAREAA